MAVTEYQKKVYALLAQASSSPQMAINLFMGLTGTKNQIPAGKVSTYKALSNALGSSPRAVGGALRNNPYAPEVPCHRVIASTGYVGGFMGDWNRAPSGINCEKKLLLLKGEGVEFDESGMLVDRERLFLNFA